MFLFTCKFGKWNPRILTFILSLSDGLIFSPNRWEFTVFLHLGLTKTDVFLFETVGANTSYVLCVVTFFCCARLCLYEMVRTPRRYSLKMAGCVCDLWQKHNSSKETRKDIKKGLK